MSRAHLGGRRLSRSLALQIIFQAEATGRTVEDVLAGAYALDGGPLDEYAESLARGADGLRAEIDALLERFSENWTPERMPSVDRNLLRLAVYEMLVVDEVDVSIAIDEAVELAKLYGTDDSSKFVNGVLGRIAEEAALNPGLLSGAAADADDDADDDVRDEEV